MSLTDPRTQFEFNGVEMTDGREDEKFSAEVVHESAGISILIPGYGTADMVPGAGPVVLLEFLGGAPRLVVWGDITHEDPTHIITLDGASESKRPPDTVREP